MADGTRVEMASTAPVLVRLVPFVLMVSIGYLAIGIPLSAVTLQVGDILGYGAVTVGWTVGIQSVATLLTRKFAADITDKRGPRLSVFSGLGVCLLAAALYGASAVLDARPGVSLAILTIGRIALGVGESLLITGTLTWGVGTVGQANAGKVMTWNGIAMYAAIAVGAPFGLVIMKAYGFFVVALSVLVLPLVAFLIAAFTPRVALHGGVRLPFYKVIGRILSPGLGLMLSAVGFAAIGAFVALDYRSHGWNGAGYALTAFGVSYILMRLFLGGLPDRLGGAPAAMYFLPVEVVGQMVLWAAPDPWTAVIGAALSGFGFSLVFPAFGIEAVKRVPPQNRGAALGGYVAFFDAALGLTGPLAGIVAGLWGYPAVFSVGAVAAGLSLSIALREGLGKKSRPGIS
jgi:MFS family permease